MHLQRHFDTYFNKDTDRTVLYFLVYDQELEKQKDFKNVMCIRGNLVSTCQLYKPLAEKHKCRKYFQLTSSGNVEEFCRS